MLVLNQTKKNKLSKYRNILGVILARENSKGIKNKNLLKINNKTLIEIAINNALKSRTLSKVIFSSESNKLIKEANKKIKVSFKRPKNLAKDNSSTYDVVKHAVNWLDKNENWKADIVVILPPTSPLRKAKHIDDVVDLLIKSNSQAAMTIVEPSYPPYWMFKKVKMKYQFILPEGINIQRRQDTPKVYQPSGMVWALKYDFLFKMKGILPQGKTAGLLVKRKESINIDNELDFDLAKILAKKIK
jgi:CMP-N,N'-diacetyllegionaminic acid synthase